MTPLKQAVRGLAGCVLAPAAATYSLRDGTPTHRVALTVSLLLAEPSLRRFAEGQQIACEQAAMLGYRMVRSYADAVACGLA